MVKGKEIGSKVFSKDMTENLSLEINNKLGQDLIKASLEQFQEQQKKLLVNEVSQIMERISVMQRRELQTSRRLDLLRKQLGAINSGKIIVDMTYGVNKRIKFEEEELNIDWSETEQW